MRRHFVALLATSAITLTSACALAFSAPVTTLDKTSTGNFEIDPSHTSVNFGISHMGFSTYQGRFDKVQGSLAFDAKNPENSKLNVQIDANSIDTNNEKLQTELKSKDWFNTATFPAITFTSTSVQKLSATTGKVVGDLTLHGVTKPVVLEVTFNGTGSNPINNVEELGFSAHGTIKRSEFGISQYIPMVGDEVAINIETEMHLKQ